MYNWRLLLKNIENLINTSIFDINNLIATQLF